MQHSLIQFFNYDHLPDNLKNVSRPFGQLAVLLDEILPANAEKTTALRNLLSAKDNAVRAIIYKEPATGG